jgi:hypothetical protein
MKEEKEKKEERTKGERTRRRIRKGEDVRDRLPRVPRGATFPVVGSRNPRNPRNGRNEGAESQRPGDTDRVASSRSTSCEEMSRLYAAGEMSPAEASVFEAHLAGCDTCKELIGEWKGLFSLLSCPVYDAVHLEPSRDFDRPIMAFVKGLIRERQRAEEVAGRARMIDGRASDLADHAALVSQRAAVLAGRSPVASDVAGLVSGIAPVASRHAEVARRRAIWVGVAAAAAVLVIFSEMLSNFAAPPQGLARPYVLAITWVVSILHKSFDWLVFSFLRGIKIGEVFVLVFEKLQPIWNGLGVAARHLDPQLVVMEVLLFMLSLVLLKGFLGTAPKGRCTNVGIIL